MERVLGERVFGTKGIWVTEDASGNSNLYLKPILAAAYKSEKDSKLKSGKKSLFAWDDLETGEKDHRE